MFGFRSIAEAKKLNLDQRRILHKLFINLNKCIEYAASDEVAFSSGGVYILDSSPGTGKTFTLSQFGKQSPIPLLYVAYSSNLKGDMDGAPNIDTATCCSFLCRTLKIKYMSAINLWYPQGKTFHEMCRHVFDLVESATFSHQILVIDEYTVLSPWMIVWFMWCVDRYLLHIIFVGDSYQHASMSQTKYCTVNNFTLLSAIPVTETFTLTVNVRQNSDAWFQKVLAYIRSQMASSHMTKMEFSHKLMLYKLFKDRFYNAVRDDAFFFAQYHRFIKQHIDAMQGGVKMPYVIKKTSTSWLAPKFSENSKFPLYLYLKVGCLYKLKNKIVRLTKATAKTVTVQETTNRQSHNLVRTRVTAQTVHKELHAWLAKSGSAYYQYPLNHLTSTYHAIQGMTIPQTLVDFQIDVSHLNSLYVGLSRLSTRNQINSIQTTDLESLKATSYYNDDYFYFTNKFDTATVYSEGKGSSPHWRQKKPNTTQVAANYCNMLGNFCKAIYGQYERVHALTVHELMDQYPQSMLDTPEFQ